MPKMEKLDGQDNFSDMFFSTPSDLDLDNSQKQGDKALTL